MSAVDPPILIERATFADVEAIQALERHCFGQAWTIEQYGHELRDTLRSLPLVARDGEIVVGYGSLQAFGDQAHLPTLAVRGEWRRRGIGARMLEALLSWAVERGAAEVWLEVRSGNEPALALYLARGFTVEGRRRDYYSDPPDDGLVMVLRLEPDSSATSLTT